MRGRERERGRGGERGKERGGESFEAQCCEFSAQYMTVKKVIEKFVDKIALKSIKFEYECCPIE
jgi:hypothetical protein